MAEAYTCDVCNRVVRLHRGTSDAEGSVTASPEITRDGTDSKTWPNHEVYWRIRPGPNVTTPRDGEYDVCQPCTSKILAAAAVALLKS